MRKKKLHFSGFFQKDRQWSSKYFIISYIILGIFIIRLVVDFKIGDYINLVFGTLFMGYLAYDLFRKNVVYYKGDDNYILKIKGQKLEIDASFISQVWLENDHIHIQRVNRVDSFGISHIREKDVQRLLHILEEYQD